MTEAIWYSSQVMESTLVKAEAMLFGN